MAVKCGNFMPAVRGLRQVLEISGGQRLKIEVVSGLIEALEGWGKPKEGQHQVQPAEDGGAAGEGTADTCGQQDQDNNDEAAAEFFAFTLPGLPLLSLVPLPSSDDSSDAEALLAAGKAEKALQALASDERNRQILLGAVGVVLKQAVNMSCCTPEVGLG